MNSQRGWSSAEAKKSAQEHRRTLETSEFPIICQMSRIPNVVETQKFRILAGAKGYPGSDARRMPAKKSRIAQARAPSGGAAKARRGRGRPRQIAEPERRKKLIEAAEHVFVELGYGTANMDDIAHRAR